MEGLESGFDEVFDIRSANDWINEARAVGEPKMLFGEMWLEGELAVMFGGSGMGKSLLAMQIAESIARGRAVEPFEMTAAAQNVLYLDVELTAKQFQMRYATELTAASGETSLRQD